MSEQQPERQQKYEGPWRKSTPTHANTANEIYEYYNGRSGAERLNDRFGEGNWRFDTARFDAERQAELAVTREANKLAAEGLRNVILSNIISDARGERRKPTSDTYVDDEGNRMVGKIQNRAAPPAMGDITISPDGDRHFQEKYGEKE